MNNGNYFITRICFIFHDMDRKRAYLNKSADAMMIDHSMENNMPILVILFFTGSDTRM